jgi:hypothetical protein
MFRKFTKKRLAVLAGVTTLALAAIAFAFFSSTGSGTGSAGVADPTTGLTLHGSITGSLGPGDSKDVALTADNSNSAAVKIHNVSGTITVGEPQATAGCAASNFRFDDGGVTPGTPITEDQTIAGGASGVSLTNPGKVSMPTSGSNQDVCKGASLTLSLASN